MLIFSFSGHVQTIRIICLRSTNFCAWLLFLNKVYMKWAGHLTARSDVYSFGVVLLELLTGRKSVDKTRPSKEQNLVDWARPKLNDKKKLLQVIDPRLENQYSVRAAQKACSLAYYCLSQNPKARPLMSDVVETLEPLQSCSDGMSEVSTSSTTVGGPFVMGGISNYRMHHRFAKNVGPGSGCRSPNPNCSPGGPAACRVRWPVRVLVWRAFSLPAYCNDKSRMFVLCISHVHDGIWSSQAVVNYFFSGLVLISMLRAYLLPNQSVAMWEAILPCERTL